MSWHFSAVAGSPIALQWRSESAWPVWLRTTCNTLFIVSAVVMLMATLIRHRRSDSFTATTTFFPLALAAFPRQDN